MRAPHLGFRTPNALHEARLQLAAHRAQADAAAKLLDQADASEADGPVRQKALGLALYELQDYAGAIEHLANAQAAHPTAETAARLAMAAWRSNDFDLAEKWARTAVASDPEGHMDALTAGTQPSYQAIMAQVLLSQGKLDAARAAANNALVLNSKDVTATTVLAIVQVTAGEADDGIASLAKAETIAPAAVAAELRIAGASFKRIAAANVALRPFGVDIAGVLRRVS